MESAFVVVAASGERTIPDAVVANLDRPDAPGVLFDAGAHETWRDASGRVLVACWQRTSARAAGGTRWLAGPERITMVTGELRRRGSPWRDPVEQTAAAIPLASTRPCWDAEDHDGLFCALSVDRDGNGAVTADALALRHLFHTARSGLVIVGTHPELVARASLDPAARPELDEAAVAYLAVTRDRALPRTGFAGVEILAPGDRIELRTDRDPRLVRGRPPWATDLGDRARDPRDLRALLDLVEDDLTEAVDAAAELPAPLRLLDLTGGRDSRLVVAAAVLSGSVDRFSVTTLGTDAIEDVRVAHEICDELGLPHLTGDEAAQAMDRCRGTAAPLSAEQPPWSDQARDFVRFTAGTASLWRVRSRRERPECIRVGGLVGEAYRSPLPRQLNAPNDLVRWLLQRQDDFGLLVPEVADRFARDLVDEVTRYGTDGVNPNDLYDHHKLRNQIRQNLGLREERSDAHRLLPLGSGRAVRAAYHLGPRLRSASAVHRTLARRADARLDDHRLAGDQWPPAGPWRDTWNPSRGLDAGPLRIRSTEPRRGAPGGTANLAQHRRARRSSAPLVDLIADHAADRTNPAWSLLDRDRTLELLHRYDELPERARRAVCGAGTAAVWLDLWRTGP